MSYGSALTVDGVAHDEVTLERRSLSFIVVALTLTCGLYGLVLGYSHYRAIRELNPRALDPMLAFVLSLAGYAFTGGLLSLWFSWTGLFGLVTVACAIASTYLIQKELELYTRPA